MIPMHDLRRQYERLQAEMDRAIREVLRHGRYIMGPEVALLEEKLADYAGARYAVCCSSGTDALLMTLMAWEIGPGDAVITTPFTFMATAGAVRLLRAEPVFADIRPDTFNLDPDLLEGAIESARRKGLRPRAVLPVDLFGLPADYDRITATARRHGLYVLEDAAQSFGAVYRGKKAGSLGDAAATSFFPSKPLGCYGDGGAVFTDDKALWEKLNSIRVHGQGADKYDNIRPGLNGRLDTLQAAVLLVKLSVFDQELDLRKKAADRYTRGLRGLVETPAVPAGCRSAWAQYSVLARDAEKRADLRAGLAAKGIQTAVYYPRPLHLQPVLAELGYAPGDLPVAEAACSRILSLPMHPYLEPESIDSVIRAVEQSCA